MRLTLSTALEHAATLDDFIQAHQPETLIETGRAGYAAGMYSIALDHRAGLLLLISQGARTSAFALLRCLYEACMRGMWFQFTATSQELERLHRHGAAPKFETIIKSLNQLDPKNGAFSRAKDLSWEALCDYSHGGVRQLGRWLKGSQIAPHHTDEECIEVMRWVDFYSLLASYHICDLARGDKAAYESRFEQLVSEWETAERAG